MVPVRGIPAADLGPTDCRDRRHKHRSARVLWCPFGVPARHGASTVRLGHQGKRQNRRNRALGDLGPLSCSSRFLGEAGTAWESGRSNHGYRFQRRCLHVHPDLAGPGHPTNAAEAMEELEKDNSQNNPR